MPAAVDQSMYDSLTPCELECLRLARDWPTKETARLTALAPNTVDTYIRRATEKMGVNRRQAARLVADHETCPQQSISQFSRLSDGDHDDDQLLAEGPLPSFRPPAFVHEDRSPFDFGDPLPRHATASVDDPSDQRASMIRAVFWIAAIAVLFMLLVIGSVPMADNMGRIGKLLYPHH